MAKMIELLKMWLDAFECPLNDTRYKLQTGEYGYNTPKPSEITADVVHDFCEWCDGCASEALPNGVAERMISAYKDYLFELEKSGHADSFGNDEWFHCVVLNDVSDIEIRTTWEDIRFEEQKKVKSKEFCR